MSKLQRLEGIITPLVTPLSKPDRLDTKALRRLVRYVLDGGVHGVFPLGTTGEFPHLTRETRRNVIEVTVEETGGRVPVLAGIADTDFQQVIKNGAAARKAGADAAVVIPPYYFPLEEGEMEKFFVRIADEIELPVMIYNNPPFTGGSSVTPATLKKLSADPAIIGVKDSRPEASKMTELIRTFKRRGNFRVFCGAEGIAAEALVKGAHGCVLGTSNLIPAFLAGLYNAAKKRDLKSLDKMQSAFNRLRRIYTHGRQPWSSYVKGLKVALSLIGICSPIMSQPLEPLHDAAVSEIIKELSEFGIL
ncbi:MAG: dihydrodipicolinate synthase family protein [bacterium]